MADILKTAFLKAFSWLNAQQAAQTIVWTTGDQCMDTYMHLLVLELG